MKKVLIIIAASTMLSGCFLVGRINKGGVNDRLNWHDMTQDQIRAMGVDAVVAHLRHEYDKYECPQKSDRMHIPEDVWQQIDWTDEEIYINAALPHKLWNMRHDDYEWHSCHKFRGENAKGPLAGVGHDKYFPPLPVLVKGHGIARWMTAGDTSILEIPILKDYDITWTTTTLHNEMLVTERKCGHPNYGQTYTITKEDLLANYAPSPIQKFSDKSWLETYPYHVSYHTMIKKNEPYCGGKPNGPDKVYFWRYGWRWDSLDNYYNKGGKYVGGHWN